MERTESSRKVELGGSSSGMCVCSYVMEHGLDAFDIVWVEIKLFDQRRRSMISHR